MMDDILKQIKAGEVSGVQFKERILDKYDIACELVAFSNSHGGKLVIGIKDKTGGINAMSYSEVQETTDLLSDIASENVVRCGPNAVAVTSAVPSIVKRPKPQYT